MSITAAALAVAIAVSPLGHHDTGATSATASASPVSSASSVSSQHPPRTKEQRIAHHQRVVHHKHVVKQRIRERQHQTPTPTPVPKPPVVAPTPVKPAPVTVKPHVPTRQVVVHVSHRATQVQPAHVAVAPVHHRSAAPVVAVAQRAPRPELTTESAAAPAVRPVVRAHESAPSQASQGDAPAIVTVPRHVVQYVQHQFASLLPAVQIGFGLICVLGLFMMGYAVASGRRPRGVTGAGIARSQR